MFTSDIKDNRSAAQKTALAYLLVSLFCALFGAVYELFSHEVYSFYMIYAFAFPLALGCLPFLVLAHIGGKTYPAPLARQLYHSGIATLTVGSIFVGVLEIYGTTNSLSAVYFAAGSILIAAGLAIFALKSLLTNRSTT